MTPSMLVDSLWVVGSRFVMRAANFVVFLLLARALTVEGFGFYGYVMSTALVLSIGFDLGMRQSVARHVGQESADRPTIIAHLFLLVALLAAVAAAACFVALRSGYGAEFGGLLAIGALGTAPMLFLRMGQGVLLGEGRLRALYYSELVSRAVMLGGTLPLYLIGRLDIAAALWLLLLAHAAAALLLLGQILRGGAPRARIELAWLKRLLRAGLVFASSILAMILLGRVGIWLVNGLLGPEAVGLYFGVLRLGEMLVEVATAVGVVIFSHGVRSEDGTRSAREAVRTTRLVASLMGVLSILCILGAAPILTFMLGAPYAAEATAFRLIMAGTVLSCFNVMLFPSLSAQGLARYGTLAFGIGTMVAAATCWLLLPRLGLTGAGLAFIVSQAVVMVILLIVFRRRYGFPFRTMLLPQPEDLAALQAQLGRLSGRLHRTRAAG